MTNDDCEICEPNEELPLCTWYRVLKAYVMITKDNDTSSEKVGKLVKGEKAWVEEIEGNRAFITKPTEGWVNIATRKGSNIIRPSCPEDEILDKELNSQKQIQHQTLHNTMKNQNEDIPSTFMPVYLYRRDAVREVVEVVAPCIVKKLCLPLEIVPEEEMEDIFMELGLMPKKPKSAPKITIGAMSIRHFGDGNLFNEFSKMNEDSQGVSILREPGTEMENLQMILRQKKDELKELGYVIEDK